MSSRADIAMARKISRRKERYLLLHLSDYRVQAGQEVMSRRHDQVRRYRRAPGQYPWWRCGVIKGKRSLICRFNWKRLCR